MVRTALLYFAAMAALFSAAFGIDASSCEPGTFFNGKSCQLCPKGTYQYRKGQTGCIPCPPGTYLLFKGAPGRDICLPCQAGTFSKIKGATSSATCKRCPKGKSSVAYSSKCISCPKGFMMDVCTSDSYVENGVCLSCFRAFCGTSEPKLKCVKCLENEFAPKRNSPSCKTCPLFARSNPGSSKCTTCPRKGGCQGCGLFTVWDPKDIDIDFVAGDPVRSDGCGPCDAGFVGNKEFNATRCVRCPTGTFRKEDDYGPCSPCDSGDDCVMCGVQQRYNKKKKRCNPCPPNQISKGGRATKCKPCPSGSESTRNGCVCKDGWGRNTDGDCQLCHPGSEGFSHFSHQFCSQCFDGYFAPKAGTKNEGCRPCPSGKISSNNRAKCVACPKGLRASGSKCVSKLTNCALDEVRVNVFDSDANFEAFECNRKKE